MLTGRLHRYASSKIFLRGHAKPRSVSLVSYFKALANTISFGNRAISTSVIFTAKTVDCELSQDLLWQFLGGQLCKPLLPEAKHP